MPKKSKREKMLADIRRRARQEYVASAQAPEQITTHTHTFKFAPAVSAKTNPVTSASDTAELTAIKRDLTKTVVLALIAIGAELALYWFGRKMF